ncbi:MFS transporter [Caenimonas sedimenti]|uniref:MFS transporter n=1 Tax=Caenimonas sedimenti TaxID=2596921 RepID=A0A562ZFG1_9BURK|nr:MFS transporter [Caenimonas sedimenti]TWO66629.1 MFS transporter [Caenimonas sedimenti]
MTGAAARFTTADGWRYGLLGLPLAFVALPLYVLLPNHYARAFGVPLAALGVVLLVARLFDAFLDPWLGRVADRLFARTPAAVLRFGWVAAAFLALGFALLFFPPVRGTTALLAWAAFALAWTYLAYSALSIAHQSWGAMLGGDAAQRSRVVAWREGCGLAGVLLASLLPLLAGLAASAAALGVLLALACWAWQSGPRPRTAAGASGADWRTPFARAPFRRLLAVFVLNGIASAVPATLVLFFVQDRLQAPAAMEPLFLGSYFLSAAIAIPLWVAAVPRFGLARAWLAGILLAIAAFAGASQLGAGDTWAFLAICIAAGAALGTDLALPGALLAGVIAAAGDGGRAEGAYFGWWNFATKLNLALAAGLALPLLALAGYTPGSRDPEALDALTLAYCVLPCVLKLAAAALLYLLLIHKETAE